jgi:hypothetical protein
MSRRVLAWLLAVPIVIVGLVVGHAAGWRIAVPDAAKRADELSATGHGYTQHLPVVLGTAIALLIVGLVLRARAVLRGGHDVRPPTKLFALLPLLAFLLREAVERAADTGLAPGMLADRTLLIGLVVQIPFGLLALLIARALCTLASAVGRALAGSGTHVRPRISVRLVPRVCELPRVAVLALGHGERAPPVRS